MSSLCGLFNVPSPLSRFFESSTGRVSFWYVSHFVLQYDNLFLALLPVLTFQDFYATWAFFFTLSTGFFFFFPFLQPFCPRVHALISYTSAVITACYILLQQKNSDWLFFKYSLGQVSHLCVLPHFLFHSSLLSHFVTCHKGHKLIQPQEKNVMGNVGINTTSRSILVTIVAMENKKYYIFWVHVCSRIYPECKAHGPYYIVICGLFGCSIFFHVL